MSAQVPTFAGWYPDPETGGTRYCNGSRWTGDTRPRRRPFAPPANYGFLPQYFTWSFGGGASGICLGSASEEGPGVLAAGIIILVITAATSLYFFRGQGPTTQDVEKRLAAQREAAEDATRQAAKMRRRGPSFVGVNVEASDVAGAARVNAVANPETARALQNLQNLLYTQAISDAEYQAAKDNLLGASAAADSFAHIAKLVELHQAGILSDVEFAAAKAKALGI